MPKAGRGFANCIVLLPAYLEMSNMFSVFSIKLTSGSGNRQCAQRGVRRVIACLRCVFRWSFSLLWKNFLFPHPGRFPRLAGAAFRSRCFSCCAESLPVAPWQFPSQPDPSPPCTASTFALAIDRWMAAALSTVYRLRSNRFQLFQPRIQAALVDT